MCLKEFDIYYNKTKPCTVQQHKSNVRPTYGSEDTMKQTIDSSPRTTLAMSLPSWAHSPSPYQIHAIPCGQRELKFPSPPSTSPSDITGKTAGMTEISRSGGILMKTDVFLVINPNNRAV